MLIKIVYDIEVINIKDRGYNVINSQIFLYQYH